MSQVEKGLEQDNKSLIEDSMSILAEKDSVSYKKAMRLIMDNNNPDNIKKANSTCSKISTNSSSTEPLCSHLNLPLSKVCQDSDGNCIPLYRKGMPEKGEDSAFFVAAKLLGTL